MAVTMNQLLSKDFQRLFMPVGIYPGLQQLSYSIGKTVSDAVVQYEAAVSMYEMFSSRFIFTGMDLSVEAEAYGCDIQLVKNEVPTIIGQLIKDYGDLNNLATPLIGEARTSVYLEAAQMLTQYASDKNIAIIGGMIGPFSLAGRLLGMTEALEMSMTNPDIVIGLLEKITPFLISYAKAFKESGVQGIMIAEPAAGLLSPRSLGKYSSRFVRKIVESCQDESFSILLHNCGAKLVHIEKILEANADIYHFGEMMDIIGALQKVDDRVVLAGNLDPSVHFVSGTKDMVKDATEKLLTETSGFPNFILSTGCELPRDSKIENIQACFDALKAFYQIEQAI